MKVFVNKNNLAFLDIIGQIGFDCGRKIKLHSRTLAYELVKLFVSEAHWQWRPFLLSLEFTV